MAGTCPRGLALTTALALQKRCDSAREVIESGVRSAPNDPNLVHTLARLLLTCPTMSDPDPQLALELSKRAFDGSSTLEFGETLGMAYASSGAFDQGRPLATGPDRRGGAPRRRGLAGAPACQPRALSRSRAAATVSALLALAAFLLVVTPQATTEWARPNGRAGTLRRAQHRDRTHLSATRTVPPASSTFPKSWARASLSSTTTATPISTSTSVQGGALGPENPAAWPEGSAQGSAVSGRLFRNDVQRLPDGTVRLHFEDVTVETGIETTGYGMGVAAADYDNGRRRRPLPHPLWPQPALAQRG